LNDPLLTVNAENAPDGVKHSPDPLKVPVISVAENAEIDTLPDVREHA
jgi:hypothetical protein